ncbi:MAG: ornithine carbamoyltransferase [Bacillota bacterium]|jgi:ornithine carbamoyltransferase
MDLKKDFQGRDFLSLHDYTAAELLYILQVADFLKREKKAGRRIDYLKGKTLGMIFEKSSTRTRVSFESGIYYLGGLGLFLSAADLQIGRGEPLKDTARTLSRYLDGLMIRTFGHEIVLELAEFATVPVINGLTDLMHPCQVMADAQTILEHKGQLEGLKLVYLGDGNNMAHSLMHGGAKWGMDVVIACPEDYPPDQAVWQESVQAAQASGGSIVVSHDAKEAVKDADILYTDVWASMGQEQEAAQKQQAFGKFQLNEELLQKAKSDAIVLHCLPAKRGLEITDEVLEGRQSVVFDEAENRLWVQMAVMALVMGG